MSEVVDVNVLRSKVIGMRLNKKEVELFCFVMAKRGFPTASILFHRLLIEEYNRLVSNVKVEPGVESNVESNVVPEVSSSKSVW